MLTSDAVNWLKSLWQENKDRVKYDVLKWMFLRVVGIICLVAVAVYRSKANELLIMVVGALLLILIGIIGPFASPNPHMFRETRRLPRGERWVVSTTPFFNLTVEVNDVIDANTCNITVHSLSSWLAGVKVQRVDKAVITGAPCSFAMPKSPAHHDAQYCISTHSFTERTLRSTYIACEHINPYEKTAQITVWSYRIG